MTVTWLDPDPGSEFPPVDRALAEPNGLLAAGGDLSPGRLLSAYRNGIFPWYEDEQPILWWSPDPRAVLFPAEFHVSRSLRRRLQKPGLNLSFDENFAAVVDNCAAERPGQAGTWITPEMHDAYVAFHRLGHAHSVEVWQDDVLVAGVYGVSIGRVFFAESMFHGVTDASKVALSHLAEQLRRWEFGLMDCQILNPHLESLGSREIDRAMYCKLLDRFCVQPGPSCWEFDDDLSATGKKRFSLENT